MSAAIGGRGAYSSNHIGSYNIINIGSAINESVFGGSVMKANRREEKSYRRQSR
jgi:hypothetical protein